MRLTFASSLILSLEECFRLGVSLAVFRGGAGWTGWAAQNELNKQKTSGCQRSRRFGTMKKTIRPPDGDRIVLARRKGFEPLTFWSVARHSIQLS